ncbi:hypothetical protein PHYPSEUDO_006424 [Phytophthora pseudosyringae]|uniref:Uncharacterized protein n=1 Tax=Phytophthora pseudosyringae TaxID=221518 RepID=A0A8T1VM75_9STRA|nr:hypothetical protein PHYPSEUDO_006424 [Phytophthora pseudosyringae]
MTRVEEWRGATKVETLAKTKAASKAALVARLCLRLEAKWEEIQVGRQGSYSVERLASFNHYCNTTSRVRVILVCVLTPIPALTVAILLECMPLRPPSEGWKANWVFWIRLAVLIFVMLFAIISQLVTCAPDLHPTFAKRVLVSLGAVVGFVGACIGVASAVRFPVPLMWTAANILGGVYLLLAIRYAFGGNPFDKKLPTCTNLRRYYRYFFSYMALGAVCPMYKVLYAGVLKNYRVGIILALPMWRFAGKHFILWATHDLEDFVPGIVTFSVDFYNALFVSLFMSNSGSMFTSATFIAVDLAQVLLEFREIRTNAQSVLQLLQDRRASHEHLSRTNSELENVGLLKVLVNVINNLSALNVEPLKNVRLWACLPHTLARQQKEQPRALEVSGLFGPVQQSPSRKLSLIFWKCSRKRIEIAPVRKTGGFGNAPTQT